MFKLYSLSLSRCAKKIIWTLFDALIVIVKSLDVYCVSRYTTWIDDAVNVKEYEILAQATWKLVKDPGGLQSLQTQIGKNNVCDGTSGYRVSF